MSSLLSESPKTMPESPAMPTEQPNEDDPSEIVTIHTTEISGNILVNVVPATKSLNFNNEDNYTLYIPTQTKVQTASNGKNRYYIGIVCFILIGTAGVFGVCQHSLSPNLGIFGKMFQHLPSLSLTKSSDSNSLTSDTTDPSSIPTFLSEPDSEPTSTGKNSVLRIDTELDSNDDSELENHSIFTPYSTEDHDTEVVLELPHTVNPLEISESTDYHYNYPFSSTVATPGSSKSSGALSTKKSITPSVQSGSSYSNSPSGKIMSNKTWSSFYHNLSKTVNSVSENVVARGLKRRLEALRTSKSGSSQGKNTSKASQDSDDHIVSSVSDTDNDQPIPWNKNKYSLLAREEEEESLRDSDNSEQEDTSYRTETVDDNDVELADDEESPSVSVHDNVDLPWNKKRLSSVLSHWSRKRDNGFLSE